MAKNGKRRNQTGQNLDSNSRQSRQSIVPPPYVSEVMLFVEFHEDPKKRFGTLVELDASGQSSNARVHVIVGSLDSVMAYREHITKRLITDVVIGSMSRAIVMDRIREVLWNAGIRGDLDLEVIARVQNTFTGRNEWDGPDSPNWVA